MDEIKCLHEVYLHVCTYLADKFVQFSEDKFIQRYQLVSADKLIRRGWIKCSSAFKMKITHERMNTETHKERFS